MGHGATRQGPRSIPHWLRYWKPESLVAVARDGTEHPIAIQHVRNKWIIAMRALEELGATAVRALDKKGKIIASTECELDDDLEDLEEPSEQQSRALANAPATPYGVDVASVVQTVAQSVTSSNIELVKAVSATNEAAFKELLSIVRLVSERLSSMEQMMHEQIVRQLEAAGEASKGDPLMEAIIKEAGPEGVRTVLEHIGFKKKTPTNGAAATNGAKANGGAG